METTAQIPFTAWEQAVFVALFIVFVVGLLTWFTKQSNQWQSFIAKIEEQWRSFSREQRVENNQCISEMNKSIGDLTQVTQGLVSEVREMRTDSLQFYEKFHAHDAQAKEILAEVKTNERAPAKQTRAKKPITEIKE